MKNNKKGSTLVAAVVIVMIIMIILGAALTMASSYYKNSIHEMSRKQIYLSAKSGVELIADYIEEGNEKLIPVQVGSSRVINKIEISDEKATINGVVKKIDENTLKVTIKALSDEDVYEMQAIMKKGNLKWELHSYCEAQEGDSLC